MDDHADLQPYLDRALELGAAEAKLISPCSLVTAAWVRLKCQYGCRLYHSTLCCPPFSPTPEQTRQVLDCYQRALLIRCQPGVSVKPLVVALERELFLQGFYRAFALGAGPCFLCEECNLERCLHAYEARPSLEACGVDVYATARGNGMPLAVVRDQDSDQNHYGAVLVD